MRYLRLAGSIDGACNASVRRHPDYQIPDVPEPLREKLCEAFHRWREDPEGCCYALAVRVVRFYLGDDWVSAHISLAQCSDPFMLNELDEGSENRWIHQHRVITLGDALFTLRGAANAGTLYERFVNRETRSCFLEALVAESFADERFAVEVVRESGVRGSDFDFIARRGDLRVNVEVTGATGDRLSERAVLNLLHGKRNQVPPTHPALLFIVVPEQWTVDGKHAEEAFGSATQTFFQRSRRLNAVVVLWDASIPVGASRAFALAQRTYIHPAPRHPIDDLAWLHPTHPVGDLATLRQLAITSQDDLRARYSTGTVQSPTEVLAWVMRTCSP